MKKTLLLCFAFCALSFLNAQQRIPISKELTEMSVTRKYEKPVDLPNESAFLPPLTKTRQINGRLGDETEIMETVFDLQTNRSLSNRFWMWEDGTMAAVATRGMNPPGFPDRGTGYNFFDGSSWGPKPNGRIESIRTGWPSIAPLGENGEIVASHMAAAPEWYIAISKRETKGVGEWQESSVLAPPGATGILWPRMATGGQNNNSVHMIALTTPSGNGGLPYQGQDGALLYYRSSDYGVTWDIQAQLLEGLGNDFYTHIGADDYGIASRGSTVAIFHAGLWADMFIMKSNDNGETWQKTVIWEHPYPFFDLNSTLMEDTLYTVDNSANISIDHNGMVHVVWGIGRVARLAAAPPDPGFYSQYPYTDGIGYWNESMGPIPEHPLNPHHTMKPDYLEPLGMLVGWTQDVNGSGFVFDFEGTGNPYPFHIYRSLGISTMPTIAIDANGVVLVAFASVTETFVTVDGLYNYHHIWCRASPDLGNTWGAFYDLQADNIFHLYDECIYPVLAPNPINNEFHLIYNADNIPGLHLDDDHDPVINRIIHNKLTYEMLGITGVLAPPVNLTGSLDGNDVHLEWQPPLAKEQLYGYNVYRNGVKLNAATLTSTSYSDLNLNPGFYQYNVRAVYSSGESGPSNTVSIEIQEGSSQFFETVWTSPFNPMTFYILAADIDEIPMPAGSEVGLFDIDPITGQEICVGAGVLIEPLVDGAYLEMIASMNDGSNPDQANGFSPGNPIIYKLWNNEIGELSNVISNYPYPGYDESYAALGSAFVELSGLTVITQQISLQEGWNMMSFRVMPDNWNMLHIVQPLIDQGLLFKVLDEAGGSIFHLPFPPPNGQWSNTIGDMANTEGYYIKVHDNAMLDLEGYPVEIPLDIPLINGWNMISYPCENEQDAMAVVQPLIDAGLLFKVIDEAGGSIFHLPFPPPNGQWSNTIGNFKSNKGYYLKATSNATLTIGCDGEAYQGHIQGNAPSRKSEFFVPVWQNNPFMPMHVALMPSENMIAGDEIGIFDGDVCVGNIVFDGDHNLPLIITTSQHDLNDSSINGFTIGNEISIRYFDNSTGNVSPAEIEIIEGSGFFDSLGTLIGKLKATTTHVAITSADAFEAEVVPNPFFDKLYLKLHLPDDGAISVECFNLLGQQVHLVQEMPFGKGMNGLTLETAHLEAGAYLLKIVYRSGETEQSISFKVLKRN